MSRSRLSVFSITMMLLVSVANLRILPAAAKLGPLVIYYYALAALFFFFPLSIICADLGANLNKNGGIYGWIEEAFGKKIGFLAIWFQWLNNALWYPTALIFALVSLITPFYPTFDQSPVIVSLSITTLFILFTLLNLRGLQFSVLFSKWAGIIGTILPACLILLLGGLFLFQTDRVDWASILQGFWPSNWRLFNARSISSESGFFSTFTLLILSLCGMEMVEVHHQDVENPKKTFPKAILIATLFIFIFFTFGSFLLAIAVPSDQLDLIRGNYQGFQVFLSYFHLEKIAPLFGIAMGIGGLGSIVNWIIGPSRGLLFAAQEANFPAFFQKTNQYQMPTTILWIQTVLVCSLTVIFLFIPSVSDGFLFLSILATQMYLLMYMILFTAAIFLYNHPLYNQKESLIIGGKKGVVIISVLGIISSLIAFLVGCVPPSSFQDHSCLYLLTLALFISASICIPLALYPTEKKEKSSIK